MDNFKFKTRQVSIVQRSSSVVNSFTSSVGLILYQQWRQFKLTLDTIQNSEKLTYNFNIKARGIE